ncbi:hypothetical protein ADIARSV_1561 [Arcticibacter svalbardensis MN12-7]|uniref:KTSC domain-containing protein n=1 Tax=Arcticibacter svalbardensis MN12-7 TaxID=1150600 RepID=R9GUB5_9SPHI|nr:KTSC domain-containing protein [Arcticibacter svalbardensis]EOR95263.1 hypothetical protein ADIARSV_1561 [Arcticibacter svalbardensis MN12-7]
MIISIGFKDSILEIEFKGNGQIWQYEDVPEYLYHEMMSASSQGKFWHANIKGQYRESRAN